MRHKRLVRVKNWTLKLFFAKDKELKKHLQNFNTNIIHTKEKKFLCDKNAYIKGKAYRWSQPGIQSVTTASFFSQIEFQSVEGNVHGSTITRPITTFPNKDSRNKSVETSGVVISMSSRSSAPSTSSFFLALPQDTGTIHHLASLKVQTLDKFLNKAPSLMYYKRLLTFLLGSWL